MWDEMRMAYKLHRENGITPFNIFKMATINGAKALGLEEKVGTLEVGKKADIIAVKMPESSSGDIYSDLIRETKGVHLTMVSGKILYSEGSCGQEGTGWN
jgi:5-methylthioadenosine/S-adenosylhomocysteine deaminase